MTDLRRIAAEVSAKKSIKTAKSWTCCRELVDVLTGGDLHFIRLDILTDMVWKHVQGESK